MHGNFIKHMDTIYLTSLKNNKVWANKGTDNCFQIWSSLGKERPSKSNTSITEYNHGIECTIHVIHTALKKCMGKNKFQRFAWGKINFPTILYN